MKTYNLRLIATTILLIIPYSLSFAQSVEIEEDESIRSVIENLFEHIDKSKVPTGLLLDYATDLVDLSQYDGIQLTDSNFVDSGILSLYLRSIRSASVTSAKPFATISSIFDKYSAPTGDIQKNHSTNVCISAFEYNYLPEDALTAEKINYIDGQVSDKYSTDGNWINPYETAYTFAFSPLDNYLPEGRISFNFPRECILSNLNITRIEFDSGIGNGYEDVRVGEFISAIYSEGIYELSLRVTMDNGKVLVGHSKISVLLCSTPIHESNLDPLETERDFSYGTKPIKARVTVIRQVPDSLRRPFIIVEGFDPDIFSDYDLNSNCVAKYKEAIGHCPNLASYIADKDLVFVDWGNSEAPIEENAELLIQIINWINESKTSDEPNVILGESMGGLVARYALRTMEYRKVKHQTSIYISYDSPHQGVNIPIGAQYLVAYLYDFLSDCKPVIDFIAEKTSWCTYEGMSWTGFLPILDKYLYSSNTSANQMMMYHIDKSCELDNSTHNNWQKTLKDIGLPKGDEGNFITNIGYSNGRQELYPYWNNALLKFNLKANSQWVIDLFGGFGTTTILSMICPEAVSKRITRTLLLLPGKCHLEVTVSVDSHRSRGQKNIADVKITFTKKLLWLFPLKINVKSYGNDVPSSVVPLDNKPGSYYSTFNIMDSTSSKDTTELKAIGSFLYNYEIADKVMFVPTASALNIDVSNESVYDNSSYYRDSQIDGSSFNYCITAGTSDHNAHVDIDDSFYSKLISISDNNDIEIIGEEYPNSGSTYSLSAYIKGAVTWSVDQDWAKITSTGVLTLEGNYGGTVTITAKWNDGKVTYQREKTVILGIPKFSIQNKSRTQQIPTQQDAAVMAIATCSDLNFAKNAKDVTYEWGYRCSSIDDIKWEKSTSRCFSVLYGGGFIYLYLKVKMNNFTSETYSARFFSSGTFPIERPSTLSAGSKATDNIEQVIYLIVSDAGSIAVVDDSGKLIENENLSMIMSLECVREGLSKVKPFGVLPYSQSTVRANGKTYLLRVINKNFND